jgi:hypothetical protein
MIAMGVGYEDMSDGFPAHGVEKGIDVSVVKWTGIDDGDLTSADDIGHSSLEREWPGIVGQHPPHARGCLLYRLRRKVEGPVERNVGAHANRLWEQTRRPPKQHTS